MKLLRASWLRTSVAAVFAVLASYVFHSGAIIIWAKLDLVEVIGSRVIYGALHDSAILFLSFFIGGVIAGSRFSVLALVFALLLQYFSLGHWAEWTGTSLAQTIAERWVMHTLFVIVAMIGWYLGAIVINRQQSSTRAVAT